MKPKAVFLGAERPILNAYDDLTRRRLAAELDFLPGYYTEEALRAAPPPELADVRYAFGTWGVPALSEDELARLLPELKALFYAAGSVQAFARPYLRRGVKVFSAWGANAVPVAEVTAAEIVLANKGFFQTVHRGGAPGWPEHDAGTPYPGNYNTNVGIIGAGMIGTLVIEKLKAYRLNVTVFDPFLTYERAEELGVKKTEDLPALFAGCQTVSNHLANNPQTEGMLDKRCFDRMPENGVFLNTGRGKQVAEADLVAALKEKPARAAVLDVTYPEPPEENSELYTLPNVFLTPHMAGSIGGEVARMGEYMAAEFTALITGQPTRFEVTEDMLKTMA